MVSRDKISCPFPPKQEDYSDSPECLHRLPLQGETMSLYKSYTNPMFIPMIVQADGNKLVPTREEINMQFALRLLHLLGQLGLASIEIKRLGLGMVV